MTVASAFWVAFVSSAVLASPVLALLRRTGSRQEISTFLPEHQSKSGTPTMGGLLFLPGLILVLALLHSTPLLFVVLGFALIGFVDDYVVPRLIRGQRGLGWKSKLIAQLAIATIFAVWTSPGEWWNIGLCIFLIVFCANSYNFLDGMDGLAGWVLIFLSLGWLGALGFAGGLPSPIAIAIVTLIGGIIPFLFLNSFPAQVFMGDVGSMPVGALLGALILPSMDWVSNGQIALWTVAAFCLLLAVFVIELLPVPLQILSVKIRKKRLFGKTPVHHWLQDAGWSESKIVAAFALVQLLLSVSAVTLVQSQWADIAFRGNSR